MPSLIEKVNITPDGHTFYVSESRLLLFNVINDKKKEFNLKLKIPVNDSNPLYKIEVYGSKIVYNNWDDVLENKSLQDWKLDPKELSNIKMFIEDNNIAKLKESKIKGLPNEWEYHEPSCAKCYCCRCACKRCLDEDLSEHLVRFEFHIPVNIKQVVIIPIGKAKKHPDPLSLWEFTNTKISAIKKSKTAELSSSDDDEFKIEVL
nr:hypothetical protein [Abalone asfa-like virus]